MRIAMISMHTCPLATLGGKETGGMNVYVRDLTRELGRSGIGVDVFTRSQDEHQPHIKHDLGNGNRVFHIPAGPERPLPKDELFKCLPEFVGGARLAAALLEEEYDLIHSHFWMSGVVAHDLRNWWGVPMVHMAHTLGAVKNRVARYAQEQEPILRLENEAMLLKRADALVVSTESEREELERISNGDNGPITVIPPGVDLSVFHPYPQAQARKELDIQVGDKLLLFVGRIEPLKGVDTLLRALQILQRSGEIPANLCLSVIGGDPTKPRETRHAELEKLMLLRDELGLSDVVTFLGRRAQETLHCYYASADIVVMPSHYESFGMVALEAMACGTPVIASDVGGLAQLVRDGETGFLVPDRNPEAMAERLRCVLSDGKLRLQLGRRAADQAKDYGWDLITERIIELYKRTMSGWAE
ncbi:MAG: glycosyltransferase [Anaerolineales bacterium]|nr:glycosyltransferase [Anaerolineales bacterium]